MLRKTRGKAAPVYDRMARLRVWKWDYVKRCFVYLRTREVQARVTARRILTRAGGGMENEFDSAGVEVGDVSMQQYRYEVVELFVAGKYVPPDSLDLGK